MWPAVAEANDDGGERPSGGVFGHITLRAQSDMSQGDELLEYGLVERLGQLVLHARELGGVNKRRLGQSTQSILALLLQQRPQRPDPPQPGRALQRLGPDEQHVVGSSTRDAALASAMSWSRFSAQDPHAADALLRLVFGVERRQRPSSDSFADGLRLPRELYCPVDVAI
jgi:hypothetical protein